MFATLLVIGGVLVGLLLLLALIVSLSARPATRKAAGAARPANAVAPFDAAAAPKSWMADNGRRHPDAWSASTSEMPAIR